MRIIKKSPELAADLSKENGNITSTRNARELVELGLKRFLKSEGTPDFYRETKKKSLGMGLKTKRKVERMLCGLANQTFK